MKIKVKETKKEHIIDMQSEENTIEDLKKEIHKKLNINIASIKLIYNSKSLSNEKKLNFYGIKDGSNLVLLINKENTKTTQDNGSDQISNPENNKENYDSKVDNLVKMGYEKEKAEKALIQSEGDANKAINILSEEKDKNNNNSNNNNFLNNIKNKIEDVKQNVNEENSLPKELKKYAIFMKISTLNDPNQMNIILQNIKEKNPALLERIKDNEEEFLKFLSLPITIEDLEIYKKNIKNDRELLKEEKDESKIGKVEIILNKKESEDINKLKKLGYKIEDIIEAYLLKNKKYKETEKYLESNKK